MKVFFKAPNSHCGFWIKLTSQKGYLDVMQEARSAGIKVPMRFLKVQEVDEISYRLVPYLLGLEPFQVCAVNFFLSQDANLDARISFY